MGALWNLKARASGSEPRSMRAFGLALAGAVLAAAFWGWMTRMWFVAIVVLATEGLNAWWAPSGDMRRLGRSFVVGGMWAAIGMLVFGRP